MTTSQIQLIKIAQRALDLDDAQYRMILRSVGHVESSKDLTAEGFEDCMAYLESRGFRHQGHAEDYWRNLQLRRSTHANSRQIMLIYQLSARAPQYSLKSQCARHSDGRVDTPERLRPQEAHNLIEALKAIIARGQARIDQCRHGHASRPLPASVPAVPEPEITDAEVPF